MFKYAGYVPGLNADAYRRAFEKFGPLGLPPAGPEPCKVLEFDEYKADRITEDGSPYGKQPYTSKQMILTKRENGKLWRVMWTQKSSPEEETKGHEHALEDGWMMHVFQVGDTTAWDRALAQHEEIEKT